MAILIDGYNLMHAAGLAKRTYGPGGLHKARQGLLGLLAASLDEDDVGTTTIVFDAKQHPAGAADLDHYKGLTIRFAVGEDDADDLLEKLIAADSAPRRLLVVSSDHRLQRAARRRRARAIDSEEFIQHLASRRRRKKPDSPREPRSKQHGAASEEETDFWLREFGDLADDEDLAELFGDWYEEE